MNNTEIDNAPRKHANLRHPTVLITLLSSMLLGGIADTFAQTATGRDNAIQHLRNALEQPFLESGGFSTFDCTLTSGEQPEQPFTCSATRRPNNHYEYLLVPDADVGVKVDLVTEPAAQLDYEWLPELESSRIENPYAQLPNVYDVAEGVGFLDNGERFRIRITRSGRQDDFSQKDYTFQVLED